MQLALLASDPQKSCQIARFWTQLDVKSRPGRSFGRDEKACFAETQVPKVRLYPRLPRGTLFRNTAGAKMRMRNQSSGPGILVTSRKLVLRIGSPLSAYRTSCLGPSAEGAELLQRHPKNLPNNGLLVVTVRF
jgi:hypothetical protein